MCLEGEGFSGGRPLYLEVDGQAFRHNIKRAAEISKATSLMVVLKANAYGHGLIEMATLAGQHDLAVAIPEEMRQLREAQLANRIWVLEGPFAKACIEDTSNVIWVVHSLWQLALFENQTQASEYKVCLKLDTGMNRLGMNSEDFALALKRIESNQYLSLYACMTHFSASDLPGGEQVDQQLQRFNSVIQDIESDELLLSTANSGGILYYPHSHKDIVRPGIILYGAMPSPEKQDQNFDLKPVMKLKSAIMAVRELSIGERVGYGGRWRASRESRIATVACGYGDGYPRHAPDGTPVAVFDSASQSFVRAPLVGRVSMDMLAIDITDIPSCGLGSPVELWGDYIKADELASLAGTIAYELFCSITTRVPRLLSGE